MSRKPTKKHKSYRWWKKNANINKVLAITSIATGIIAIVAIFSNIKGHHQTHRPIVVFSRPIQQLEPFECKTGERAANFGESQAWIKNVGNAQAKDVFVFYGNQDLVSAGQAEFGGRELYRKGMCSERPPESIADKIDIAPGEERRVLLPRGVMMNLDPIQRVQLVTLPCVYYSDEYGLKHATCSTFKLYLQNKSPYFTCDYQPFILGVFLPTESGQCQN